MAFQTRRKHNVPRKRKKIVRENRCRFCRDKVALIDYKDLSVLTKLVTTRGKLFSRKRSGNCQKHQSQSIIALKRARFLALMAFAE
ncbi:MAG: 30S ribosomal protein S18 [Actinobacteria bacterium]|nr:30S ribosomal protein S18 [Actinomycetota bacterium]